MFQPGLYKISPISLLLKGTALGYWWVSFLVLPILEGLSNVDPEDAMYTGQQNPNIAVKVDKFEDHLTHSISF